eukprot:gene12875-7298_t
MIKTLNENIIKEKDNLKNDIQNALENFKCITNGIYEPFAYGRDKKGNWKIKYKYQISMGKNNTKKCNDTRVKDIGFKFIGNLTDVPSPNKIHTIYPKKGNAHYRFDFQGAYNNDENVRMGNIQFQVGNSSHTCILYPVECKDATLLRCG